jgi:hypothetical protein
MDQLTPIGYGPTDPSVATTSECTIPKRHFLKEIMSLVFSRVGNVKRESWRQSTTSPKIGILLLVLIMHTAWSPNTSSGLNWYIVIALSNLGRQISTALPFVI